MHGATREGGDDGQPLELDRDQGHATRPIGQDPSRTSPSDSSSTPRTEAGLSQRELAERMGTTQSGISRLEEGGAARNRIDTLARVATALNRHLVLSFPEKLPAKLKDAVQVA